MTTGTQIRNPKHPTAHPDLRVTSLYRDPGPWRTGIADAQFEWRWVTMTLTVIGGLLFLAIVVIAVIARRESHTNAS